MAFNKTATATFAAPTAPAEGEKPNTAAGFLNFYIPTKGGGRRKIGYVVLRKSDRFESAIAARLIDDPDAITQFMELLEVEFNDGVPSDDNLPNF